MKPTTKRATKQPGRTPKKQVKRPVRTSKGKQAAKPAPAKPQPQHVSKRTAQAWNRKLKADKAPLPAIKQEAVKRVEEEEDQGYEAVDIIALAKMQFPAPDDKVIRHVVKHIMDGNRAEVAFATLGIPARVYKQWALIGLTDTQSKYGLLLRSIMIAEARSESQDVREIRSGASSWTAKAWLRSRTAPNRWGDRTTVELGGLIEETQTVLEPAPVQVQDAAQILAILEGAGALGPALTIDTEAVVVDPQEEQRAAVA